MKSWNQMMKNELMNDLVARELSNGLILIEAIFLMANCLTSAQMDFILKHLKQSKRAQLFLCN